MIWSHSADREMRRCQRLLAIDHIMASGTSKDPDRREAYILGQLQDVSRWRGTLVHEVLATQLLRMLKSGRPVHADMLVAAARELARRQLAFSAARRYREAGQTKTGAGDAYCALVEHERGEGVTPEQLAGLGRDLAKCFTNLVEHRDLLSLIRSGREHDTEARIHFRLDSRLPSAIATLDLFFFDVQGRPTIVDWKAGESLSDARRQLLIYALAVVRSGHCATVNPEQIQLYEANLLRNRVERFPVTASVIEEAEDLVYSSLVDMDALVGGRRYEDIDLNEFEVANRPTVCRYCPVAPLCIRLLEEAGRPDEAVVIQGRLF